MRSYTTSINIKLRYLGRFVLKHSYGLRIEYLPTLNKTQTGT